MCYIVLPQSAVLRLCQASQRVQESMDNGTLAAAMGEGKPEQINAAVTAFDQLNEATNALLAEIKGVSPFLRFRKEILADYPMAARLRCLVLGLWNAEGLPVNFYNLFSDADEHHTRIALELIVAYSRNGERDEHFMDLASEIRERISGEIEREAA
ncbi:MAG TPA: hypothetical protein VJ576_09650 [Rhodocyclaceae bacterium]|nr:hypothetical protein [Rhodocyclaceae bacterium]